MRGATSMRSKSSGFPLISIHAPHAGRDFYVDFDDTARFISIHAPHAGRDISRPLSDILLYISIHAPHAGRDAMTRPMPAPTLPFQSTRPMRGATSKTVRISAFFIISIHAPHAGRDPFSCAMDSRASISIHAPHAGRDNEYVISKLEYMDFNPRAPCGARRRFYQRSAPQGAFQSTRPMRGATIP